MIGRHTFGITEPPRKRAARGRGDPRFRGDHNRATGIKLATGPVLRATHLNPTGAARCRAGVKGRASTDGCRARSPVREALLKQVLPAVIPDDWTGAVGHHHTALGCSIWTGAPATVAGAGNRRHGIRPDDPSYALPDATENAPDSLPAATDDAPDSPADATENASYASPDATDDASGCPPDAT